MKIDLILNNHMTQREFVQSYAMYNANFNNRSVTIEYFFCGAQISQKIPIAGKSIWREFNHHQDIWCCFLRCVHSKWSGSNFINLKELFECTFLLRPFIEQVLI